MDCSAQAGRWFRQLAASSGAPEPERPIMPSEAWNDYVYIHHLGRMFIQLLFKIIHPGMQSQVYVWSCFLG